MLSCCFFELRVNNLYVKQYVLPECVLLEMQNQNLNNLRVPSCNKFLYLLLVENSKNLFCHVINGSNIRGCNILPNVYYRNSSYVDICRHVYRSNSGIFEALGTKREQSDEISSIVLCEK